MSEHCEYCSDMLKEYNNNQRELKLLRDEVVDLKKGIHCPLTKDDVKWITEMLSEPVHDYHTHVVPFLEKRCAS